MTREEAVERIKVLLEEINEAGIIVSVGSSVEQGDEISAAYVDYASERLEICVW